MGPESHFDYRFQFPSRKYNNQTNKIVVIVLIFNLNYKIIIESNIEEILGYIAYIHNINKNSKKKNKELFIEHSHAHTNLFLFKFQVA